jgi:hypothetical protein
MSEPGDAPRPRPLSVTILAVLAGVALLLSVVHFLQALGILPYFVGPVGIKDFNIWHVLMWGLMIWVWWWAFRALWVMDVSAWVFVVVVAAFSAIYTFTEVAFTSATFADTGPAFIISLAILAIAFLPSTKTAFEIESTRM